MCKIIKIRYVSPSGRRSLREKMELCSRSDGYTPCLGVEVSEVTELVSSGTPSLVDDEISTPASASIPGTPLTATANYQYREPHGSPSSKSKKFGLYLDLGGKSKKSSSPTSPKQRRHRSERSSKSGSSNGDVDSIIGIEEDGRFSPISPRSPRFSLGPPLSMRRPRDQQPPVVSQPQPPSSFRRASTPAPPSLHRRNLTAPYATVRFSSSVDRSDTELQDRAAAREALRRENRQRDRLAEDVRRLRQEADDRKMAEDLDAKERKEQAEDDFSMREWNRLQEKDRLRRERRANVLHQDSSPDISTSPPVREADIDKLEKEIREMKIESERRKQERDAETRKEEALRNEKRIRDQEAKIEYRLQEELTRINRQAEASNARQLLQVQAEIDRLEGELKKQRDKREARNRAEQLRQEIKHEDLLAEEIRELENEIEREQELRRFEQYVGQRAPTAYDRQRYLPSTPAPAPLAGYGQAITQPYPPAPMPPQPQQVIHQRGNMSPYEDPEYRRARGEQVLQEERARAAAATGNMQRAIQGSGSGLGRRNTIGGQGQGRTRDQVYRDVRKQYPG